MKAVWLALVLAACGGPAPEVRCTFPDGWVSVVVCSCASSCTVRPDLQVDAEVIAGCGPASCWREDRR